jgi:FkbM family methyltransferase
MPNGSRHLLRAVARRASASAGRMVLQRPALQPAWDRLHRLSLWGMGMGLVAARHDRSGELGVLDRLAKATHGSGPLVVVDAGANEGGYAEELLGRLGDRVQLHCFEPGSQAFGELVRRLGARTNVELHRAALGDRAGTATLHLYRQDTGHASLYERDVDYFPNESAGSEDVEVTTLDTFAADSGLDRITFLKIDVEGHEVSVLEGARVLLRRGAVELVQFEFGSGNLDSRTFLHDVIALLGPRYRLWRVLPGGIAPMEAYDARREIFELANYLALVDDPVTIDAEALLRSS